jgi:hypothetical protein
LEVSFLKPKDRAMSNPNSDTASKTQLLALRLAASRRRYRIGVVVSCSIVAVMFLIALADHGTLVSVVRDELLTEAVSEQQERTTGRTVLKTDPHYCKQLKFDNRSGKMTEESFCYDETVRDSNGVPKSEGTPRRIDAISKAFLSRTY